MRPLHKFCLAGENIQEDVKKDNSDENILKT